MKIGNTEITVNLIPWAIAIISSMLLFTECNRKSDIEYIEKEVKVLVPSVEGSFEEVKPVKINTTVVEIDSTYYEKYISLKDSVSKLELFKEAIEINEYSEKFIDSLQTIEVYTKTRGEILGQSVKYKTNPYYVETEVKIPIEAKRYFSIGTEVGVSTIEPLTTTPVVKGNLLYTNKKGNTISISYDTEGRAWIGKTWKL
ncbi:hypothetical protein Calle1_18 [Cellulophaga phage Calle_1]|uniref:Uncharacterized protein n=1 Tax=Cellulophaga phage Calle_1 TaxID=2745643 RepID=A0A8E5EAY7_9CAUD|nr:hypothetical protein M1M22_gp018 [Cellulophaga phage Calle_1]QQV89712.1 hypothetical protein Calle1_18 [Cellulophaga phage Calle_1]QQV89792.1 hypothetical protein Calle2_18 [Cellulophaga phage Calle_2]QQV89927.1 hypothetical protein Calle3_18 [Cellulophaga phage Calle_3]